MKVLVSELRYKEVIDVADGSRYGYVGDAEVDLDSGRVCALVVPGRLRLFGLLGREADRIFPWESVRRFGEDIILVESGALRSGREERRRGRREGQEKIL